MGLRKMRWSLMNCDYIVSLRRSRSTVLLAATGCTVLLAFAIYVRTMAPTVTWRHGGSDSGDFITAAINLGVPHPTGYPLYTLIAHLFTALPGAEPAWNVTFLSVVAAALAVGATFRAAYQLIATQEGATGALALAAAWAAASVLAFGELLWSQATVAEVYSLNAFLVAILLAVALSGSPRARPYVLTLLFGLGLAHHVTIVWLLPALWPYLPAIRQWLTVRRSLRLGFCLLPGLLAYLYIPIRAAHHPVPNWGQADDLSGFIWLVSGAAYRQYLSALPASHLLQRLSAWAGIWVRDFGVLGLALALMGVWRGLETDRRFTWSGLTYVLLLSGYAMLYVTIDSYLYLIPAAIIIALWMAQGAVSVLHGLQDWARSGLRRHAVTVAGLVILAALPLISIITRFQAMDLSVDYEAYAFAENVLEAVFPDAIVVSDGDTQTFPLWYLRYGLEKRPDVIVVDRRLLAFDWYRGELASQYPELAMVAETHDAQEAIASLVQEAGLHRPVHLTYSDDFVLGLAAWAYQDPVFTLLRE
jgi:hypothetical protein